MQKKSSPAKQTDPKTQIKTRKPKAFMSNVDASDLDGDDVERSLVDTQACPGLDVLDDFQDEDVLLAAKMANCITPVGDGSDLIGGGGMQSVVLLSTSGFARGSWLAMRLRSMSLSDLLHAAAHGSVLS